MNKYEIENVIKRRMAELQLKQADLAKQLGVSRSAVCHYINGRRDMNSKMLKNIEIALNLPAGGLMSSQKITSFNFNGDKIPSLPILKREVDIMEYIKNQTVKEGTKTLSMIGFPQKLTKQTFWFEVSDNLMQTNAKHSFSAGDYALIEPTKAHEATSGQMVLVRIGPDDVRLGQFESYGKDSYLKSHNSHLPPISLDESKEIIGLVIGKYSSF